ncbi:MAG TPA: hypothetical protein VN193_05015 [Candidatus Angelobacter sp.]|jgi:hypothetical protein|nr:hypothetical protein [Candidatus Angelobacter sp.]
MAHRTIAAASAALMALAGVQTAGVLAAGGATGDLANPCAHWVGPGSIDISGRPSPFPANLPAGIYIWHDCYGWHLRSLDPDPTVDHGTAGSVTVDDGRFTTVNGTGLTGRDSVSNLTDVVRFRFKNDTGKDGVDFRVSGESVTFHIAQSPGGRSAVFLGSTMQVPPTLRKFTVRFAGAPGAEDPETQPVLSHELHQPVSAVREPGLSSAVRRAPEPGR